MYKIEQFYDKGLAHASYAVLTGNQVFLIDPARNPAPYYAFAKENNAEIIGIIETHPHADFVSSHLEIHLETGAPIYVSELYGAAYNHIPVKDNQQFSFGELHLLFRLTPGHSPDSISVILLDTHKKEVAVFTGDTLFIGDVGRPDLRESAGNIKSSRIDLAKQMYHSTRNILMLLPAATEVYPAHGAGSLCGKSLSAELSSTIGAQLEQNYALQAMPEDIFVETLLADQPFMPKYFGYNVELNKTGAPAFLSSISKVQRLPEGSTPETDALLIDIRQEVSFKEKHLEGAMNIQLGGKFETWLGSIVNPGEKFYLIGDDANQLEQALERAAYIGYELFCKGLIVNPKGEMMLRSEKASVESLQNKPEFYTILDVRNKGERATRVPFENSLHIPLPELRERLNEIPSEKPVIVHCAAGYRSAAAQSILEKERPGLLVYDLSDEITKF